MSVCVVAGISLNVNLKHSKENCNKLSVTLNNVEALANTETPDRICYYLGSLDCPNYSPVKVLYIQ